MSTVKNKKNLFKKHFELFQNPKMRILNEARFFYMDEMNEKHIPLTFYIH